MFLAGDIGGTKTVVALFDEAGGDLKLVRDGTFPSKGHASLEEILAKFLARRAETDAPGRLLWRRRRRHRGQVPDDESALETRRNRAGEGDQGAARQAAQRPGGGGVRHAVPASRTELTPLNPHAQPRRKGNVAVIAAGTGLGEAMLYWDGQRHHPLASEGGHVDFAPSSDLEDRTAASGCGPSSAATSVTSASCRGRASTDIFSFPARDGEISRDAGAERKAGRPAATRASPSRSSAWPAKTRSASPRWSYFARSTAPRRAIWP